MQTPTGLQNQSISPLPLHEAKRGFQAGPCALGRQILTQQQDPFVAAQHFILHATECARCASNARACLLRVEVRR